MQHDYLMFLSQWVSVRRWLMGCLMMLLVAIALPVSAQVNQIPQVKAFLPNITEVRPGEVTALDGLWKISSINKLIRIDRGRAYAIDGWVHLFVLKVQPAMVVIQDIVETEPGSFSGYDLPLMGAWAADITGDRILDVIVKDKIRYQLIPQQLDDEAAFNQLVKQARTAGR